MGGAGGHRRGRAFPRGPRSARTAPAPRRPRLSVGRGPCGTALLAPPSSSSRPLPAALCGGRRRPPARPAAARTPRAPPPSPELPVARRPRSRRRERCGAGGAPGDRLLAGPHCARRGVRVELCSPLSRLGGFFALRFWVLFWAGGAGEEPAQRPRCSRFRGSCSCGWRGSAGCSHGPDLGISSRCLPCCNFIGEGS